MAAGRRPRSAGRRGRLHLLPRDGMMARDRPGASRDGPDPQSE